MEKVEQLEKEKNILEKRQEEMERLIFHDEKNEESVGRKRFGLKSPPSSPNDSSSLPIELVYKNHSLVRKLKDLRRIIQEECDSLLLDKEQFKDEDPHKHGQDRKGDENGKQTISTQPTIAAIARAYKVGINKKYT